MSASQRREKNDPEFAKQLASNADVYVNDAFGTAHRAHASTEGVTHYLSPSVAGYLIDKNSICVRLKIPAPFSMRLAGFQKIA